MDITNLKIINLRFLHALYKKGYDEIELHYDSLDLLLPIQKMLQENLIGYEIVKQEKNFCIIKNVAETKEDEFNNMLRRTFILLKSMADGVISSMKDGNIESLKSIRYLESYNNKNTAFCRRIINKKGYSDYRKSTYMYCVLEELEKIADEYKYICDFFIENPSQSKKIEKRVIQFYQELNQFFNDAYQLFYKYDIDKTVQLFKKRKYLIKGSLKLLNSESTPNSRLAHYLVVITQQITNIISLKMEMDI